MPSPLGPEADLGLVDPRFMEQPSNRSRQWLQRSRTILLSGRRAAGRAPTLAGTSEWRHSQRNPLR